MQTCSKLDTSSALGFQRAASRGPRGMYRAGSLWSIKTPVANARSPPRGKLPKDAPLQTRSKLDTSSALDFQRAASRGASRLRAGDAKDAPVQTRSKLATSSALDFQRAASRGASRLRAGDAKDAPLQTCSKLDTSSALGFQRAASRGESRLRAGDVA